MVFSYVNFQIHHYSQWAHIHQELQKASSAYYYRSRLKASSNKSSNPKLQLTPTFNVALWVLCWRISSSFFIVFIVSCRAKKPPANLCRLIIEFINDYLIQVWVCAMPNIVIFLEASLLAHIYTVYNATIFIIHRLIAGVQQKVTVSFTHYKIKEINQRIFHICKLLACACHWIVFSPKCYTLQGCNSKRYRHQQQKLVPLNESMNASSQ